jgi:hypothetical protein
MGRITHEDYLRALQLLEDYKKQLIAEINGIIEDTRINPETFLVDTDICRAGYKLRMKANLNLERTTIKQLCYLFTSKSLLRLVGKKAFTEIESTVKKAGLILR